MNRYLCSNAEIEMAKVNPMFGYEETDEGKLEYFSNLRYDLIDWFTNPLKKFSIDLEAIDDFDDKMEALDELPDKEKIDFIDNDFKDAYLLENKRRRGKSGFVFYTTELDFLHVKNTPENLKSIELKLFSTFGLMDEVDVQMISQGRQDFAELNSENPNLDL